MISKIFAGKFYGFFSDYFLTENHIGLGDSVFVTLRMTQLTILSKDIYWSCFILQFQGGNVG